MSLRIYIAYGSAADQVTALRLQALGGVNGLTVYVPPAFTRQDPAGQLDAQSEDKLRNSDVVLGVVTSWLSTSCRNELLWADANKRTIILAHPTAVEALSAHFAEKIVVFDPNYPAAAETAVIAELGKPGLQKDAVTAILALATIFLGLLIFSPQE